MSYRNDSKSILRSLQIIFRTTNWSCAECPSLAFSYALHSHITSRTSALNRLIASIISGSFKARTCFRRSFSLGVRARCSLGFGTDFRTGQTPEKKSNCSNLGTVPVSVLVFILALVPSLGLEPRPGLVRCRVSVLVSVGYQFGFSFSSSCGTDQGIESGAVPVSVLA